MIDKLSNIFGKNASKKSKKKKEIENDNETSIFINNKNIIKKIDIYDDIFKDTGKYVPVGAIDSSEIIINSNSNELIKNDYINIEKTTNNITNNELKNEIDMISQTGLFNDWANNNKELNTKEQESRLANVNSLLNIQATRVKDAREKEEKKLELASNINNVNNNGANSSDTSIVHRNVFAADDDIKRTAGGMTMSGGSYDNMYPETVGFDTNAYNDSDDDDDDDDGSRKHKITVNVNSSIGSKRSREHNDKKSSSNKSNSQNDNNRASRRAKENDNK
jgi:hypothetical protein